jgi:hypothetical protein
VSATDPVAREGLSLAPGGAADGLNPAGGWARDPQGLCGRSHGLGGVWSTWQHEMTPATLRTSGGQADYAGVDMSDATPASVQDLAPWAHLARCTPWRGHPEWFQYEARVANEVTRAHCWLAVTCATPMCLTHVRVMHPVDLDYQPGICVYCGLDADTEDHLLPRGWSGNTSRSRVLTVPACRECNSVIGAQWASTITTRREVAHDAIRRRYRKLLSGLTPSPEDLAELGPNLRSYVEASLTVRQVVEARLAWPPPLYDVQAMQRSEIDDPEGAGLL